MLSSQLIALVAASTALGGALAQTSLYIPGFDPQPVAADVLGVGADGRTTWQLVPGTPSGGLSENGFIGTATLIQGPNDAQLIISNPAMTLSESCTINGGNLLADCTVVGAIQGVQTTETLQETASPFPVQVGSAAPTSPPAPSAPSSPAAPQSPSSPASPSGPSPAQTPSGSAPSNAPTNQPSDASSLAASSFLAGVVGVAAALSML